jgi:cytochrome c peroxidase
MKLNRLFLLGIFTATLLSCKKEALPELETIEFQQPNHFPAPVYDFSNNPVTREGFELGRMLFYDTRLSSSNTVSCASCHHPELAFSDAGKALSQGVGGAFGARNSPSLANLAWYPAFMWDGGVNHIEISSLAAIVHPAELNMDFAELLEKLRGIAQYQVLFERAFGTPGIDDQRFFYAVTQFTGLLISSESKYDLIVQGKANFSNQEQMGKILFDQHCAACHAGVLQSDFSFRNNGLDSEFTDEGRKLITNNPADLGKFRVPSLRNVAFTAPYMHDGRFNTLEDVMMHYTNGIQSSATLDPILFENITLNSSERAAIVAFLHTLSDSAFINNPNFANPF